MTGGGGRLSGNEAWSCVIKLTSALLALRERLTYALQELPEGTRVQQRDAARSVCHTRALFGSPCVSLALERFRSVVRRTELPHLLNGSLSSKPLRLAPSGEASTGARMHADLTMEQRQFPWATRGLVSVLHSGLLGCWLRVPLSKQADLLYSHSDPLVGHNRGAAASRGTWFFFRVQNASEREDRLCSARFASLYGRSSPSAF